jgi:L-lactate permease
MKTATLAVLPSLPIAVVELFLLILRRPASQAMTICYITTAGVALFVWQIPAGHVAEALRGLVIRRPLNLILS